MNDITGVTADEITGSSSPPPQQPQPTAVAPSPGRVKRKEAQVECEELYAEFGAWEELNGEAEKELMMALRLYDAKQRRIEKAQKGKRHGSPFGELERIYKAELDLCRAKQKRSEVEAHSHNSESNWLSQKCRMLRLENAKLRRMLRTHSHDQVCV